MTVDTHIQPQLPFSSELQLEAIAQEFGTPLYVHDENAYRRTATETLAAPNSFGLSVRYAMKANSHGAILRIFTDLGIGIDASSYYEVRRALAAGVNGEAIQLSSQEVLTNLRLKEVVEAGVIYNATSLTQLRHFADVFPENRTPLSVRINPGLGSGHNNRTNTAGHAASFGIWKDYLPDVLEIAKQNKLTVFRLHSHVGSGSDWRVWQKAARMTLDVAKHLPDVETVNLGGGYKIDRMHPEKSINFQQAFLPVKEAFEDFANETGRELKLEIEPGTFLVANSCLLLARVNDIVDTGDEGYHFLKLDASMTEILRPMIYGARHPLRVLGKKSEELQPYVVVGLTCESGDIFTPSEGNPEQIGSARLPRTQIGDIVAILGAGAYANSMSVKNYNSRPACAEVIIRSDGSVKLITRAEIIEDVWGREL